MSEGIPFLLNSLFLTCRPNLTSKSYSSGFLFSKDGTPSGIVSKGSLSEQNCASCGKK